MLHSVILKSLAQLRAFERKVARRFVPTTNPNVESGRLVRVLSIEANHDLNEDDEMEWLKAIVSILAVLPLLRGFTLTRISVPRWSLVSIPPPPTGHLTSLAIEIGRDPSVLSHINQLKTLQSLSIDYWYYQDSVPVLDTLMFVEALILPAVTEARMEASDYNANIAFVPYIARCRFHPLCRVCLDLCEAQQDQSDMLAQFFDAHTFNHITLLLDWQMLVALAEKIVTVETVQLPWDSTPPEIFMQNRLPAHLCVTVHIDGDVEDPDVNIDHFWQCLRSIQPLARRDSRLTTLSIWTSLDYLNPTEARKFLWSDGLREDYAAFIGGLTVEAARLYKEGVIIVDGNGRNITQLAE
jgi:hypothetical protein